MGGDSFVVNTPVNAASQQRRRRQAPPDAAQRYNTAARSKQTAQTPGDYSLCGEGPHDAVPPLSKVAEHVIGRPHGSRWCAAWCSRPCGEPGACAHAAEVQIASLGLDWTLITNGVTTVEAIVPCKSI